jgi:hypothetical protein
LICVGAAFPASSRASTGRLVEAERTRNPDFFWAVCDTRLSFGVETSLVVETYDLSSDQMVRSLVCTGDEPRYFV